MFGSAAFPQTQCRHTVRLRLHFPEWHLFSLGHLGLTVIWHLAFGIFARDVRLNTLFHLERGVFPRIVGAYAITVSFHKKCLKSNDSPWGYKVGEWMRGVMMFTSAVWLAYSWNRLEWDTAFCSTKRTGSDVANTMEHCRHCPTLTMATPSGLLITTGMFKSNGGGC
jgi:hypothetical protein